MCGFHSITSLPHSPFCICPAIMISSHMDEKQSMYRLKHLIIKGKTLSLYRECFRQKGLENSVRYTEVI